MDKFRICIEGHLDGTWADWLGVEQIVHRPDGTTALISAVPDQAALYGLLVKMRDLGLSLLAVRRLTGRIPDAGSAKEERC